MKKDCHALEKFKIETGVAGSIFELQPPNFVKMHNFQRPSNDIPMAFGYLQYLKSFKKLKRPSCPFL